MTIIQSVRWSPDGNALRIVDQRRLPEAFVELDLSSTEDVCDAIRTLAVRGAPAIGVAGAIGLAVTAAAFAHREASEFHLRLERAAAAIRGARPTAVNLPWAIDRMLVRARACAEAGLEPRGVADALRAEATAILDEDRAMCRRIGEAGLPLIPDGARVLTHCNAGALATAGVGTALAPVYLAAEGGRRVAVFADETRPLPQGSRLTAWELSRAGIPVTVLTDSMAASLMRAGEVDLVIVGADRIAANGDVANKVGTYALAVAARHHGIPFYVAAPTSTLDGATPNGDAILIEHRPSEEVTGPAAARYAPAGPFVRVHNPAFDVTPGALVTAIVTDQGIVEPPFDFLAPRSPRRAPSGAP